MLLDIYLIRHGQPQMNTGLVYNTPPGPPLTEQGRAEAQAAAAFLADKGIEHLFVSPFARTTPTAEAIVDLLSIDATFLDAVAEHGPGETPATVRARIAPFLDGLEETPLQRIGIVTHGSPLKEALLHLSRERIDLSKHIYPYGNHAPTCGIWHVRCEEHTRIFTLVFKPSPIPANV